jgi:hypothetical protein
VPGFEDLGLEGLEGARLRGFWAWKVLGFVVWELGFMVLSLGFVFLSLGFEILQRATVRCSHFAVKALNTSADMVRK